MDLSSLTPDKQVKLQYWLDVIRQCRASGLTNQLWCEQHDISLKSYYYWLSKIRKLALPKDIHNSEASKPAEAILRLNQLFNIESELEAFPPDQKKKERLIREKPLLEAFWSWAEKSAIGELPKSKLSKAFHYALNNREGFWNYLEDGNCSISNSLAENCIRPFVIGRKNWLFSGSPKGAEASAGIYTLVETAKANGLAPMKYIKYILSDMPGSAFLEHPEYLDDYLPWNPLVKEFCR